MRRNLHPTPRGMSLVELLVVVAIIGLLAVTVLPSLANTAESRRSREAARTVSSFVATAQSRSIGHREWAGFSLTSATAVSMAAIDMFLADVPPPYRGDTVDATLTCGGSGTTRSATPSAGALASINEQGVNKWDLIRFDGRGPPFELAAPPNPSGLVFRLLGHEDAADTEDLAYVARNTPWPAVAPAEHTFEIFRRPLVSGAPVSILEGRAVDLAWSGLGPANGTYRRFNTAPVTILYDGTGRLRQVVLPTTRWVIIGPVFLLVGRADRAGNAADSSAGGANDTVGANWQYPDSFWVAIDPSTGTAKVAECKPSATDVLDSQAWVREALLTGGG